MKQSDLLQAIENFLTNNEPGTVNHEIGRLAKRQLVKENSPQETQTTPLDELVEDDDAQNPGAQPGLKAMAGVETGDTTGKKSEEIAADDGIDGSGPDTKASNNEADVPNA